jgi:hypothetical protein
MQQEEIFYAPTLQDISLDEEGRVVVNDPQINEQLLAAAAKPKPPPKPEPSNGVCPVFNTVAGCGAKKAQ